MEIKELQNKIRELKDQRDQYDAMKRTLDQIGCTRDALEADILQHFEENAMTSFRVDGVALISISEKMTVKTPKTPEDKTAFFNWLRDTKGPEVLLHYQTINSQSLNSFFKAEWESMSDEKKLTFVIPGIEAPSMVKKLSVRKA